jgi:hypothetical protein
MKPTILLPLLVVGAYAATVEPSRAADTIYRSVDFDRPAAEMADCPGHVLIKRHPELTYVSGPTDPGAFISGAWPQKSDTFTWMFIAKQTGSKSSRIELHFNNAKPADMAEVWQVIEDCAKK